MENNRFEKLKERANAWAEARGIFKHGTDLSQHEKTEEECFELKEALEAKERGEDTYINSKGKLCEVEYELLDALGDIPVTWIIQCKRQGIDPLDALEHSINVIEKRTSGKMIDGKYEKDA